MRHKTYEVKIGNYDIKHPDSIITMGGNNPIVIQAMTNTDTEDINATVAQIISLYAAGAQMVRVTVNTIEAGNAIKPIKEKLMAQGCYIPIVGDFHFNGHKILQNSNGCAEYLDKYRINPGNVGTKLTKDDSFSYIIKTAIKYNKAVRIGANWGSLDQDLLKEKIDQNNSLASALSIDEVVQNTLVESALLSANRAIELGLAHNKIIISCKVSKVSELVSVYKQLAEKSNFALHLGLTEAGMGLKGIVSSSIAVGSLLQTGIGDTIRISLTPKLGEERTQEVIVAKEILQALNLRSFAPSVTACPGCGRTSSNYFIQLAQDIESHLHKNMLIWKNTHPGVENMKIAVMGCVVNGPGESKMANIGISLPGKSENPVAPVFVDGQKFITLKGGNIASEFIKIIDEYVNSKY
jgi:(E)-4-hydroxy-3-methylbut-2-enyl-diphosphate synthase